MKICTMAYYKSCQRCRRRSFARSLWTSVTSSLTSSASVDATLKAFSNVFNGFLVAGIFIFVFCFMLILPTYVSALLVFFLAARSSGLRLGPLLFGVASLTFLMLLPSPILAAAASWMTFKSVLNKAGPMNNNSNNSHRNGCYGFEFNASRPY